jgi:hypothetical protein
MMISATEKVAVREWVKVPNFPGLYRNAISGRYYGMKKLHGKRYECSLRTTDRQIAERRLRNWIHDLEKVDRELERTTLRILVQKFEAANQGKLMWKSGILSHLNSMNGWRHKRGG